MATLLRRGPYRFHFYSREEREPAHVHVARDDCEAKFWLEPVFLVRNYGSPGHELNTIAAMVEAHKVDFLQAWAEIHGR